MKRKPTSYARFYALLGCVAGDRDVVKETLVERFTAGRTSSLRQMRAEEYDAMCDALEAEVVYPRQSAEEFQAQMRKLRSAVLRRIQKLGINTTDWNAVDRFCSDKRIMGKTFVRLSAEELRGLVPKLEAMIRKASAEKRKTPQMTVVPFFIRKDQLPS